MSFGVSAMWIAGASAVMGVGSAYSAGQGQKMQSKMAQRNAQRQYDLKVGVSEQQLDEQGQEAMSKMTEVTRQFLQAKGQLKAVSAESGVSGNVAKRKFAMLRTKESETKGKVAKEINTNVVNIAQGMLAEKIDTERLIQEAKAKDLSTAQLAMNMRSRMRLFIKKSKFNKNTKTFKLIGCSPTQLKSYIAKKFKPGMTWQNHGDWHIDHIKPLSLAKSTIEMNKLFHYSNLQPLWAEDNLKKNNKINFNV